MPRGALPLENEKTLQTETPVIDANPLLVEIGHGLHDILCFSHLRWDFVTQRPQHLLSCATRNRRVFYWEEPIWHAHESKIEPCDKSWLEVEHKSTNLWVIRPHLQMGLDNNLAQASLLDAFLLEQNRSRCVAIYYTPMALAFSAHVRFDAIVYDCMDELSGFLGAPAELVEREKHLFSSADVVFTGGLSLFEAKRQQHHNVHAFPSSIDVAHFARASRLDYEEPPDQASIPRPRVGFYGVVDERFDVALLADLARMRPQIQFIVLGPVVKIDPTCLPFLPNIHYLPGKSYEKLPSYLAGWDAAMMPFAHNDATRFISPTKTPEFLAAGKQVVSTSIRDVVRTYGEGRFVAIADTADDFARAIDAALEPPRAGWQKAVNQLLSKSSWETTWTAMDFEIRRVLHLRKPESVESSGSAKLPAELQQADFVEASFVDVRVDSTLRAAGTRPVRSERFDYLVVGAGFAGAVVAERLASQLGKRVLIVDKRNHVAGNAYDHLNEDGILVHRYGPHIFHTNSQVVVDYLSQFTEWRPYEHRVLAEVHGQLLPVPINLDTINRLYGLSLDGDGMREFLKARAVPFSEIRTSEQIVLSRLGHELYELFFRNYTRKQWGLDPSELDSSVAGRIPVRYDRDDRYFSDSFQAMPRHGYTRMFERMLDHRRITVRTEVEFSDIVRSYPKARVVYTGPIDEYFGFQFGRLPYRSLRFQHQTYDMPAFQTAPVINYPNVHDYTRVTEFKYLTGQKHTKTSVVYEYPSEAGDPYYPIPRPENAKLLQKYRALAEARDEVVFCGRLANYRYFNMDQVVAQALATVQQICAKECKERADQGTFGSSISPAVGLPDLVPAQ